MLSLLPFEVRRAILKNLTTKDLVQCQLVNGEWYATSVELLYSTVIIDTDLKSDQYIQTLSSSRQLATYLRRIDIQNFLKKMTGEKRLNDHDLLTTITQQCLNLMIINAESPDTSFWNRICYAGSLGQLPRIQMLPVPRTEDVESYINTILYFKNTLTQLYITFNLDLEYDLKDIKAYKILLEDISGFKNLKHLTLKYPSNKQISCFDALIEDCSKLQEVSIELSYIKMTRSVIEYENIIPPSLLDVYPRPDIRSLCCNWESVNNQYQLEYVIHKFPSLQSLEIYFFEEPVDNIYDPPSNIVKFLRYAMTIPYFSIEFPSTAQNIMGTLTELIDINDSFRDLVIDHYHNYNGTAATIVRIEKTEIMIQFPLFIPIQVSFLSKAGSKIRSLTVDRGGRFRVHFDMNTVFRFLHLCPSLQALSLCLPLPENIDTTGHPPTFQNMALKKLTIACINNRLESASKLINFLSPNCPNIKQLHLTGISYYPHTQLDFLNKLDVPNTRLDLLSWDGITKRTYSGPAADFKVYIYLRTKMGVKLYVVGSTLGLSIISKSQYNEAIDNHLLCFHITCLSLTEFRIKVNCRVSTPSCININLTF